MLSIIKMTLVPSNCNAGKDSNDNDYYDERHFRSLPALHSLY